MRLWLTAEKAKALRFQFFISRNQAEQVAVGQGAELFRPVAVGEHKVAGEDRFAFADSREKRGLRQSRGAAVLQTERMANLFIDVLRSYMRARKFKVHEFVVMPTHVHVLLTVGPEMSIETAVQMMKGNFSYRAKRELGYKWVSVCRFAATI